MAASSSSKSNPSGSSRSSASAGSKRPAQSKKTPRKKTAAKKPAAKTAAKDPVSFRGLKAFICLALAVVALIGCFTSEGIFIGFFRRFAMGLVGKGFFFMPVTLLVAALEIILVRDKPLGARVACTLLLTVMAGALLHLFACDTEFEWSGKLLGELYTAGTMSGRAGSGGVLGGIFAEVFRHLFNQVGAAVVLVIASLFLLLVAMDTTIGAVIRRSRDKAARKAQEWAAYREEEQARQAARKEEQAAAAEAARAAGIARAAAKDAKREQTFAFPEHPVTSRGRQKKPMIDIPLDDEPPRRETDEDKPAGSPALEGEFFQGRSPEKKAESKKKEKPAEQTAVLAAERDLLAEILTRDRLKGPAPGSGREVRTAGARSRELKPVETAIYPKKEERESAPEKPAEEKRKTAIITPLRREPEAEPVTPSRRPAAEESAAASVPPVRRPVSETAASVPVSAPADPAAAAILADEKAAKAADRADTLKAKAEMVADIEENMAAEAEVEPVRYVYPPLSLLSSGSGETRAGGMEELKVTANRLSATIKSFGIPAEICDVTRGPTVTRYEVELEQGVKLNRLTNLSDDIALALGVGGVRIAPIPDKISIVGIEVPNKNTTTVYLREILEQPAFRDKASHLAFAVGKDIGGNPVVGDIGKLTHLLIAGTTGSGKSVCMNSLILSLLYKSSPEEVRLIMVDPKMIELGVYNGIPHLLIPVVTDPKKAAGALQWAVMEMLRRYRMIADSGTRDLDSYNRYAERTEGVQPMPRLVILIDELADLMLVAAKDVEESICRIAQMGRAAGIHMVIATQRPSADVITGLMKANIPSRIAFAVDSALNSRIILDASGAEKLVGKGDMLYAPIGAGKPTRVQGTFVTDGEREDVVNFVKEQGLAHYDGTVQDEIERSLDKGKDKENKGKDQSDPGDGDDSGLDEMFDEAVQVVLESKMASVSMLQRRLKLGYSRAARIVDQMEEKGIVGPFEGSKPRAVLMTLEEWKARQGGEDPGEPADPGEGVPAEDEQD